MFRNFVPTAPVAGSILGMLTALLVPQSASAGQTAAAADHTEHAAHQDHHHHHEVVPGYQRSLVSYSAPAVTLINQDGQPVALPELLDADQPVMLNFIFTTCTAICPAMSAIFAKVQSELGDASAGLSMVSVSIDPEQDTPAALNAYARRFDAGPQWQFLTGSLDDSIAVQRAFDADRGDKMNHAPLTLFRATPDSQWVRYEGFAPAAELVKEYRSVRQTGDAPAPPGGLQSRAGYSAGYRFGGQLAGLQRQSLGIELESVFRGILDALSGGAPRLSAAEMDAALKELESSGAADTPKPEKAAHIRARSRGYVDDFAALNAKREGVVTLPSGVQYEVLRPGSGKRPAAGDAVLVSYQASLTNGAVFDSTYEDGEPVRLQLEEIVVPGLKEALLLMNEGAQWRVVIPPSMGFRTAGNNMLRRRDLIYEIELVSVAAPAGSAAATATAPAGDSAAQIQP
jgi:protein SCO1/2